MKVLFITPYITSPLYPSLMRNKTGFGLMVYDIANNVGKDVCVEMFIVNAMAPALKMENFKTIKRSWMTFILGLKVKQFIRATKFLSKYKLPTKEKLRVVYQFCALGQIANRLKKYDLIHIHGCTPITTCAIDLCKELKIPFLVTLHGPVSFQKAVSLNQSLKQYERDFLKEAAENNYYINFISSGDKKIAELFFREENNELQ